MWNSILQMKQCRYWGTTTGCYSTCSSVSPWKVRVGLHGLPSWQIKETIITRRFRFVCVSPAKYLDIYMPGILEVFTFGGESGTFLLKIIICIKSKTLRGNNICWGVAKFWSGAPPPPQEKKTGFQEALTCHDEMISRNSFGNQNVFLVCNNFWNINRPMKIDMTAHS